jgi:hypothetical protein
VPGETSFISRFTLKFVEIVAAGVATAVSGYVVAHLSGFFPAPAPTIVQVPTLQAAPQAAPSVNAAAGNRNAQPATSASIDTDARRLAPQPDLKPAAVPPARATADVAPPPARKPVTAETSAAETKPHDTAETKSRSTESLEAQVRAALAKADSARPVPAVLSHQAAIPADVPHAPPAAEAQPRPPDAATGAIPVTPRTADAAPQQAPVFAEPPAGVVIKSLPVAGVDSAPEPAPQAQAEAQPTGNDFFSAIKHIPDFLSPDSHPQVPADRAPRPPMPVGQ